MRTLRILLFSFVALIGSSVGWTVIPSVSIPFILLLGFQSTFDRRDVLWMGLIVGLIEDVAGMHLGPHMVAYPIIIVFVRWLYRSVMTTTNITSHAISAVCATGSFILVTLFNGMISQGIGAYLNDVDMVRVIVGAVITFLSIIALMIYSAIIGSRRANESI